MDANALILTLILAAGQPDVQQLGSPQFKVRVAAHERLTKSLDAHILAILIGERSDDAEIRCRCQQLASAWYRKHAETLVRQLVPQGWNQHPWIEPNLLPYGCGQHYLQLADKSGITFRGSPQYERWSEATRLYLVCLVANRQPTAEIIERFCEAEEAWRQLNNLPPHKGK